MYINNSDEAKRSHFYKGLEKDAQKFGLEWCFADISDDIYDGSYFFCGTDISSYLTTEEQIRNVIKRGLENDCFFTKIKAFELTGHDDFVTHQHIMIYMQNLELLKRVYEEKEIELPKKLDNSVVFNIRTLYANRTNAKTRMRKLDYDNRMVKEMLNKTIIAKQKEDDYFVYDSSKGKLANFFRKHFSKHPSCVSINHLSAVNSNVETIFIRYGYKDAIVKALDDAKFIPYSISSQYGEKINARDGEGLGSDELNDTRAFSLSYGKMYSSEVSTIINKILYPDLFVEDFTTLGNKYGDLIPFSVPSYEYENIVNLLTANNIPFAYGIQKHDILDLDLVVPECYIDKLDNILNRLATERENFRICAFPIIDSNNVQRFSGNNAPSYDFFQSMTDLLNSTNDVSNENRDDENGFNYIPKER